MQKRKLGSLEVSTIGYGCMGLSMGYGTVPDKKESLQLIRQAYDWGCTFFDTAERYAAGDNEALVGEALQDIRDKVVIATKFMLDQYTPGDTPRNLLRLIREKLENSLRRLRTDHVGLYYQHRVNKDIPVEDIAWCMGELIKEGKIRGWGQSQATEAEIRRAHAITPLTAVQNEYSMMERQFESAVIPACEELHIGFVPFSPLANGFLSGKVTTDTTFTGFDARRVITRFEKDNMTANQPLLALLQLFATQKAATPAQISLAWMLHKKDFIVPIPGSRKPERVRENFGAAGIVLTAEEYGAIESALSQIRIHGNRTDEDLAKLRTL
ncbi:aryl-alcohol dehydrogenase-like predicted oxidoreductase [Chitinophaga polysaccharea]|uniref:Aryl-alcohol dehydrogenase-like predicted oxidoreductase n=1 Tax=Chitinophaga polysaccharea TaxID=1293035 RepID=A0A561PRF5_9BACT|nr:aldo/keto reductase [Chitinophaga polysaccharea]TWF40696.1 aryl-alcohol dehydrogenase-like predicted oxidoreductase [Chitinophaga polysaccharea]